MKKNKSKGFTLIELLVVISIITLLSSVVLASIKTARDRAFANKTASELKSLQNALELYRNAKGFYPQYDVDDDEDGNYIGWTGFNSFVQTELVANKYIAQAPRSRGYPNNCIYTLCSTTGNILVYSAYSALSSSDPNEYWMCGGQRIKNYVLIFLTKEKLNLPIYTIYTYGNIYSGMSWNFIGAGLNEYCLSM